MISDVADITPAGVNTNMISDVANITPAVVEAV